MCSSRRSSPSRRLVSVIASIRRSRWYSVDRHRAAEPRRQRVDEILQLGHAVSTLQMSNQVETVPVLGVRLTVRSFVA